jgi:hypothetical protein
MITTDARRGLDFKTREDTLNYEARLTRALERLAGMSKPTIAKLQVAQSAAVSSSRSPAI